jgi:hypothetical protein
MEAEDLNVPSAIRDHGLYLFDLSPVKQPGGRNMRFKEIGPQQLEFVRDMWQLSRAKVVVTMGGNPASAVVHLFEKRILFIGNATHLLLNEAYDSPQQDMTRCHVLFEYASEKDMADHRILRVVFQLNHPEFFNRHRERAVTPSSHALLAAERFLDLALLLSVRQVARPAYFSTAHTWHSSRVGNICMDLANFDDTDPAIVGSLAIADATLVSAKRVQFASAVAQRKCFTNEHMLAMGPSREQSTKWTTYRDKAGAKEVQDEEREIEDGEERVGDGEEDEHGGGIEETREDENGGEDGDGDEIESDEE